MERMPARRTRKGREKLLIRSRLRGAGLDRWSAAETKQATGLGQGSKLLAQRHPLVAHASYDTEYTRLWVP